MKLIYILGEPGAGKSTLTAAFQANWKLLERLNRPFKHELYELPDGRRAINLGHSIPPFGGTDTLPYTVGAELARWLPTADVEFIYGEGDRLASEPFFTEAKKYTELHLFHLSNLPGVSEQRRSDRAHHYGLKLQDATWVKGRATKHRNLALKFAAIDLPGHVSLQQLCGLMWNSIDSRDATLWD